MRTGWIRGALGVATVVVTLTASHPSLAASKDDDAARCEASYESAQVLRRGEHLEAARTQLQICETTCPAALSKDCSIWLRDVEALIPTVHASAHDSENHLLTDIGITVDGSVPAARADGAIAVEPGTHVFRFEKPGFVAVETSVEVHAGERNHPLDVVLLATAKPVAQSRHEDHASSTTASWVLGGIGAVAIVTGGALAIAGDVDRANMRESCAPSCDPSRVDTVAALWWTAGGLAAVGAVALGVGIVIWPRAHDSNSKSASLSPSIEMGPRSLILRWRTP